MQSTAAKIVNFVRSPLWVSNNFASEFTPEGKNFDYDEAAKQKFKNNPDQLFDLRHQIEHAFNKFFYVLLKDSPQQAGAFKAFTEQMKNRLNNDPWLCAKLVPTFEVGCRRLSPGDNYLDALLKDNVKAVFDPIQEITEKGIRTHGDAEEQEFDIIICATGFDVSFRPSWDVQGKDGIKLAEQWKDHPEAYFGTCVPNMPNYFTINGPNSPLAHGSLLSVMSWTVEYISRWCKKISEQGIK
jgi:cation diffusion facilitator CzcD-associated flavoprotein CzcO